jgi:hypothetical protein
MAAVSGSIYKVEFQFRTQDCLALYAGKGVDHTPPHNLVGKCAQLCRIEYGVNKLSKGISVVLLEKPYDVAIGQTPLLHNFSRIVPIQTGNSIVLEDRTYSIEEGRLMGEKENPYEFHLLETTVKKKKKVPDVIEEKGFVVRFNFEDRLYFRDPVPFPTVRDYLEWLRIKDNEGAEKGAVLDDKLKDQIRKAARVDILHWCLKIKGYMKEEEEKIEEDKKNGWLF